MPHPSREEVILFCIRRGYLTIQRTDWVGVWSATITNSGVSPIKETCSSPTGAQFHDPSLQHLGGWPRLKSVASLYCFYSQSSTSQDFIMFDFYDSSEVSLGDCDFLSLSLFFSLVFLRQVSLFTPDCPGTLSIEWADFKTQKDPPASAFQVL